MIAKCTAIRARVAALDARRQILEATAIVAHRHGVGPMLHGRPVDGWGPHARVYLDNGERVDEPFVPSGEVRRG